MAPKKKGKGKGDKLARMSVEQRQQYLDRRAAQEAESNRRKEELVAGFLKLKLSDEGKKGEVNEAKLMTKWREVLREAKTTSLNTQLQELREAVKETTARQNTLIQLLANQVGQAQHQRSQAAHNHLAAVHRLTELHEEHIGALTSFVREREAGIAGAGGEDTETLAATHLHHLRRHALTTAAALRHHTLTEKEELAAFHTTITQITTQLEEEVGAARVEREGALEEAWGRLGAGGREHHARTVSLRRTCNILTQRVAHNRSSLATITNATRDMQSEVEELRRRVREVEEGGGAGREVVQLQKAVAVLRGAVGSQRVAGRTLLKAVNARGDTAKERLESVLKEGRGVLDLAAVCRRLETTRDRNLPFLPHTTSVPVPVTTLTPTPRHPAQETETVMGLTCETDDGMGTSLQSSRAPSFPPSSMASSKGASRSSKVMVKDGLVSVGGGGGISDGSDSGWESSNTPAGMKATTGTVLILPKITTNRGNESGSGSGRGKAVVLGRDKLERISELLSHEDAAQEAGHTDTTQPLPDYVLQEADAALRTHDDLRNFYRKYHNAQLDLLALRGEAEGLRGEGRHLKGLLRQYFVTLGISDAALALRKTAPVNVGYVPLRIHPKDYRYGQRLRSRSVPASGVRKVEGDRDTRGSNNTRGGGDVPHSAPSPSLNLLWPRQQHKTHLVQEARLLVRSMGLHTSGKPRTLNSLAAR